MAGLLKRPRKVMLMVKAGAAVDEFIELVLPHLEPGDVIIDGGNSHFPDTIRRTKYLESKGLLYVGTGVSGGEEGARFGPSMMPGGSPAAWPLVKDIFQAICARTPDGEPCCDWMGEDGAGHYVKMVHNGIEYGDMQLICEAYQLLKEGLGMSNEEMHRVFTEWNKGELDSYLIEITRDILAYKDEKGDYVVDKILDTAGQKGTGKWTSVSRARPRHAGHADRRSGVCALPQRHEGRPRGGIQDPQRAQVPVRRRPQGLRRGYSPGAAGLQAGLLRAGLHAAARGGQGIPLEPQLRRHRHGVARGMHHPLRLPGQDQRGLRPQSGPGNLLLDPYFTGVVERCQPSWRRVVAQAVSAGVPVPAFTTALAFFDGFRSERLPANLLQAQRDYFGAHTYERIDQPRGKFFHTNWTGKGGNVSSSTYTV